MHIAVERAFYVFEFMQMAIVITPSHNRHQATNAPSTISKKVFCMLRKFVCRELC